jgi:hypothetical protein
MSEHPDALARAEAQVAAARDDPVARLALLARTYNGPTGRAPRHLPFRRAALSFMGWHVQRGLINPLDASPSGSVWWRAMSSVPAVKADVSAEICASRRIARSRIVGNSIIQGCSPRLSSARLSLIARFVT